MSGSMENVMEPSFGQLDEQGLGLLQIGRVEAFPKPTVDWRQNNASTLDVAFFGEELGEIAAGAQAELVGALRFSDGDCLR